jgi:hypothetical protein
MRRAISVGEDISPATERLANRFQPLVECTNRFGRVYQSQREARIDLAATIPYERLAGREVL